MQLDKLREKNMTTTKKSYCITINGLNCFEAQTKKTILKMAGAFIKSETGRALKIHEYNHSTNTDTIIDSYNIK